MFRHLTCFKPVHVCVLSPCMNHIRPFWYPSSKYFLRFGHSQITGNMMMMDKNKEMVKDVPLSQVSDAKL